MDEQKNVIAVGNFDGIHRGHQLIFQTTLEIAKAEGCGTIAFTFDNHPRNFIHKEPVKLIRSPAFKERIIRKCGMDRVVSVPFNEQIANMTPTEFLQMLKKCYGCSCIVCGENFHFGHNGAGSSENLYEISKKQGIQSNVVSMMNDESGQAVSSSRIRSCIEKGEIETANSLLGLPFMLSGKIIHGRKFGREMGFPTINFRFPVNFVCPRFGVYCTYVVIDSGIYEAITNVGVCPTVSADGQITVESHIIKSVKDGQNNYDFYGEYAEVYFYSFIREEKKFTDRYTLQAQIQSDKEYATMKFNGVNPLFIEFE